jgi:cytochrome P450
MVVTEGSVWKAQREAFNPGFSSSFLKSALPSFVGCTQHLMEELGRAADAKETVLMHELAIMTTVEVICKVGQRGSKGGRVGRRQRGFWLVATGSWQDGAVVAECAA